MSCSTVGCVKEVLFNTSRSFDVPFLTNTRELDKGEELIVEVQEKAPKTQEKTRTWLQAFKHQESQMEKPKQTTAKR